MDIPANQTAASISAPPLPAKRSAPWPWIALLIVASGAGIFSLYYAFGTQSAVNRQIAKQQSTLMSRIRTLETALAAAQVDTVKTDALEKLIAQLQTSQAEVGELKARLESVEKTANAPAPKLEIHEAPGPDAKGITLFLALKSAVASGKPFAKEFKEVSAFAELAPLIQELKPVAEDGVKGEDALRGELADFLEQHPVPKATVEDPKLEGINTTFKGLFHIAKKNDAADPYHQLRQQAEGGASLDVLLTTANGLDDEARAALADWREDVKIRQDALGLLAAAEATLVKRQ